jgi:hypothetical protein
MKWWFMFLALVAIGCGNGATTAPQSATVSARASEQGMTPEELLRDQLSAGSFSFNSAVRGLEQARKEALTLRAATQNGELRQALSDVVELLDSAAATIAEHSVDPAPTEDIAERFAHHDDLRLTAIDSGNDARHELGELVGILESLIEDFPRHQKELASVRDLAASAREDIDSGIRHFGGEPEEAAE